MPKSIPNLKKKASFCPDYFHGSPDQTHLSVAKRELDILRGFAILSPTSELEAIKCPQGFFCWKIQLYHMKKIIIYLVTAASLVYYAALPFVVAQAGGNPGVDSTNTASTAITAATGTSGTPIFPVPLYMRVTAYASVPDETDNTPFITADGSHVYFGEAASNIFPFGTRIKIPKLFGDQIFTIEDRMSTKIKNTIDIWMPSVNAAIRFGMDHANIVIVSRPISAKDLASAK